MKTLSFKKGSDGQSDIHDRIKYVFIFLKIIIGSQKIDVRLNKNLEIKVLGDVF